MKKCRKCGCILSEYNTDKIQQCWPCQYSKRFDEYGMLKEPHRAKNKTSSKIGDACGKLYKDPRGRKPLKEDR